MQYRSGLLKKLRSMDEKHAPETERRAHILIATLRFKDEKARMKAVHGLIELGVEAVDPLVGALADPDEQVWRLAAAALVKIGQPAVQSLIDALYSDNEQTRLLAAGALRKLGRPRQGEPGWNLMWKEYRKLLRYQRENTVQTANH